MTDEEAEESAISATRDRITREYADGSMGVVFVIDPKDKLRFMKLLPEPGLRIAFVRLIEEHEKPKIMEKLMGKAPKKGDYSREAQTLRKYINWMGNPAVWRAFGTDEQYIEWCQQQVCAYCKAPPRWEMDRFIPNEAAHVRRIADGAGVSTKPPFAVIPLCHKDHATQHQHGESALGGEEWFDKQRIKHIHEWLWTRMKVVMCVDSMTNLRPEDLLSYAEEAGLEQFLPDCYRGDGAWIQ